MRALLIFTILLFASYAQAQHFVIINDTLDQTQTLLSGCTVSHTLSAETLITTSSGTCAKQDPFAFFGEAPSDINLMPEADYLFAVGVDLFVPPKGKNCRVGLQWSNSVSGNHSLLSVWCLPGSYSQLRKQ